MGNRLNEYRKIVNKMYKKAIREVKTTQYTENTVSDAASKILMVENKTQIPVPIINICKKIGFVVFMQDLPGDICGYIAVDGELKEKFGSDKLISVDKNESNKRRRFTVAHELGHYLFEFNPNNQIQFYNAFEEPHVTSDRPNEKLANRFAAELLMPKNEFVSEAKNAYRIHKNSSEMLYEVVQILSDKFLVPPKAVERRLKEELRDELCDTMPELFNLS